MKKGFTLIELLAVIVILAIIALIAFPTISGLVEKAKRKAVEDSMYGIIKSAELSYTLDNSANDKLVYICNGNSCNMNDKSLKFKGQVPSEGFIVVNNKSVYADELQFGDYCVNVDNEGVKIKKQKCTQSGLYDNKNIVYSWYELIKKYNLDVEKDYDSDYDIYNEHGTSMSYVLNEIKTKENKYVNTIKIPNYVEHIGNRAFSGVRYVVNYIFPESLKEIGNSSFLASSISNPNFPKSLEKIGDSAFERCPNLNTVVITSGIKEIGDSAFSESPLKEIKIEDGNLERIGNRAFFNTTTTNLFIPDSIKYIGRWAFKSAKNISLPGTLSSFPSDLFSYNKLENFTYRDTDKVIIVADNGEIINVDTSSSSNAAKFLRERYEKPHGYETIKRG